LKSSSGPTSRKTARHSGAGPQRFSFRSRRIGSISP